MFIDAQLERINSHVSFTREQDRLEMIWILHAARVESGNREMLDLELLLNQVGGIFKPDKEVTEEDVHSQAALFAICETVECNMDRILHSLASDVPPFRYPP